MNKLIEKKYSDLVELLASGRDTRDASVQAIYQAICDVILTEAKHNAKEREQVNPYPLFVPPPAPPTVELGPQTMAAIQNMIVMALPRPIVVLPADNQSAKVTEH
jgi:hypothetical protein